MYFMEANLFFVGDSTGLGSFQRSIHQELDITEPSAAVLNNQIANAIYPTIHAGVSKSLRSDKTLIRPFIEAQAGAETLVRVGADAAYIVDSNYLPNSGASKFEEFRPRARAGLVYQTTKFDAFYGVSWLGKEFETQPDDQIVGSLSFRLSF